MGSWKSLFDRVKEKKDELQRKAVKKAARTAIDSAGKAVERVLFGKLDDDEDEKAAEPEKPDPFAKLKAAEAEKKEREREEKRRTKERAAEKEQLERDVDADLAELKKKLGK